MVRYSSIDSNLYRAMFPDSAGWTRNSMLLAEMTDTLHWLQWAKTKDGAKNRRRPAPIPRPGVTKPQAKHRAPKASPLSEIRRRFPPSNDPQRGKKLATMFGR